MSNVPSLPPRPAGLITHHSLQEASPAGIAQAAARITARLELGIPYVNSDGIMFEPFREGNALGYKVTEIQTGLVEYILLNPSTFHGRPGDGSSANTFVYHLDHGNVADYQAAPDDGTVSIIDFAYPVTHVNHFVGSQSDPDPSDPDTDPWSAPDEHDPSL